VGFDVCFALQPLATWIDKSLTREEREIFAILDRMPTGDWRVLAEFLSAHHQTYVTDVRQICERLGVQFLDLNAATEFAQEEWLFVDRVHLTDRGYALAAELMQRTFAL
jgi:lysophospholipase L1-like esterase